MKIQNCQGIILSSKIINEADYLCEVFTDNFGKLKLLFSGLAKSKKRSVVCGQTGTITEILFYYKPEKEIHSVKSFQEIFVPLQIRNNLTALYALFFCLECSKRSTGLEDKNIALYKTLEITINTLSQEKNPQKLALFFVIHLLRFEGILPNFLNCNSCGIEKDLDFYLDLKKKQIFCASCKNQQSSINLLKIEISEMERLRHYLQNTFGQIKLPDNKKEINHLIYILSLYLEENFKCTINSKNLLLQI